MSRAGRTAARASRRAGALLALSAAACLGPDETTEVHLPTEEQAQAEADARISSQNADAEFEALLEEIESGG